MAKKDRVFCVFQCPETEKYLVLLKTKKRKGKKRKWSFVGGKVDKKEHHLAALTRETREEIGHQLTAVNLDRELRDINHSIFMYRARMYTSTRIVLSKEHRKYRWVTLRQLKLLRLNRPARIIMENL